MGFVECGEGGTSGAGCGEGFAVGCGEPGGEEGGDGVGGAELAGVVDVTIQSHSLSSGCTAIPSCTYE